MFVKLEALCHITAPLQFSATATIILLYPFLVMHGINSFGAIVVALGPSIEPFVSACVACYAKVDDACGRYRTFGERSVRLGLILPYFALKSGILLFETKSILEGLLSDDATFLTTPKEGKRNAESDRITKSAIQVVRRSNDDFIALAGLILGISRLYFVITYDKHSPFSGILRPFNCMLAFSFIFVNTHFLIEKYHKRNGRTSFDPFRPATKHLMSWSNNMWRAFFHRSSWFSCRVLSSPYWLSR